MGLLQEVPCLLQEAPIEPSDRPKFILEGNLKVRIFLLGLQTPLFPSINTCQHVSSLYTSVAPILLFVPSQSHKKNLVFSYCQQSLFIDKSKAVFSTYHTYQSPSGFLIIRTPRQLYSPAHVSLHPRRRSSYRTSYRNPVAVYPSRRHTLQTGTTENEKGNMKRAHLETENIVTSQS